ncbi:MAG TPA: ABC transporter permease [Lachnospiraceae bacterium]|nr:ABC transporter permease [Lachnospiraceae bacterium]
MKKLGIIFQNGIRRSLLLIPLAILIITIMGVCFVSGRSLFNPWGVDSIPVGIMDQDQSMLTEDMILFMKEKLQWTVTESDSFQKLTQMLLDCDVAVILEIPKGFEESMLSGDVKEVLVTVLDDYANEAYTKTYLNSYVERTLLLVKAANGDRNKLETLLEQVKTEQTEIVPVIGNAENRKKDADESGLSFMVGFFTLVGFGFTMFMGVLMMDDKKNGTLKRVQVSSIKPITYIGGMALANICMSVLCIGGIGIMLAGFNLESNVPIWLVMAVLFIYIVFCLGFNLMTALLCKNTYLFSTIGIGFISISNIMGGAYFPIDGSALSRFSVLTPQYYIMNIVRGLAKDAEYACITDICVLLLMIVLIYLVAAVVYAKREI